MGMARCRLVVVSSAELSLEVEAQAALGTRSRAEVVVSFHLRDHVLVLRRAL